ncbi:50S ribosomal protein L29 [candidate division WOR-3 bacterium JGI_Cruoil_03_51_56]|uniref:Large ribosomal subunit protein uL29 n=1 Tax=candidate division WOR-3 bacterium JGI_Cruoil_03_51_56 TaxID=1973747 RepID=A0A235BVS5_UNCW3|nr:MAG: 50S ribosomal protein L29 [candidate division WOR-3 bacterium JGI_Cruoil_03_51_56]
MRASELREMTREELEHKTVELRGEMLKLRLRRGTESLPNPLRLRMLRRDIARCLTVMREKELTEAEKHSEKQNG